MYYGLDTEDDSNGNVLLVSLWGEDGTREVFRNRLVAQRVVCNLPDDSLIWTTNLEYDIVNLFHPELDKVFPAFNGIGKLIRASVLGRKVAFTDTLAFYQGSVRKLGEIVGLPKLEFNPNSEEYCLRDAEISCKFGMLLRDMLGKIGGAELKWTSAGTAYNFWKKQFAPRSIYPACQESRDLAHPALYGGRCEIFRHGKVGGPIYHYDFSSMYPSVMLGKFPIPKNPRKVSRVPKNGFLEAEVKVNPKERFPILPLRHNGKLIFPVGRFSGVWVSDEFNAALESGQIKSYKVLRAYEFDGECYPFLRYIDTLWRERESASPDFGLVLKLLMNSLYGKFGQGKDFIQVSKSEGFYKWGDSYYFGPASKREYPFSSIHLWAGIITARARLKLHSGFSEDTIYCDTDSYFSTSRMKESGGLGGLQEQGIYEEGEFRLPKMYRLRSGDTWDIKLKGFPLAYVDEAWQNARAVVRKPVRLRESIRTGKKPNVWILTEKRIEAKYTKRRVMPDGNTCPLLISVH